MRLDKYLADMSLGTRSEVKELIRKGKITVNGKTVKDASLQIRESDSVACEGQEVSYVEYEYYLLNKPKGYICALEDRRHPVIMELIRSRRKDLVPVGRLDLDTEGAILLTNDGQLNHFLLSPKNHVPKTYYAETDNFYSGLVSRSGKAGDCVGCGQCEGVCPQHLPIIKLLKEASQILDVKQGA